MSTSTYETLTLVLLAFQALAIPAALTKWAFQLEKRLARLEGHYNVHTRPSEFKA